MKANALVTTVKVTQRERIEFHHLVGLMRSSFPPPSANRIHRRLGENRVSTLSVDSFHAAIGSNQRVDLATREGWVNRRGMVH